VCVLYGDTDHVRVGDRRRSNTHIVFFIYIQNYNRVIVVSCARILCGVGEGKLCVPIHEPDPLGKVPISLQWQIYNNYWYLFHIC